MHLALQLPLCLSLLLAAKQGWGLHSSSPPAALLSFQRAPGLAASNVEGSGLWNGGIDELVQNCGYGLRFLLWKAD